MDWTVEVVQETLHLAVSDPDLALPVWLGPARRGQLQLLGGAAHRLVSATQREISISDRILFLRCQGGNTQLQKLNLRKGTVDVQRNVQRITILVQPVHMGT